MKQQQTESRGRFIVVLGDEFHSRHHTEQEARAVARRIGGWWCRGVLIPPGTVVEVATTGKQQ